MLKLRPRVQNLVHMSVSTLEMRAPFWCLVLRPLHTLWSLVCAKGVVGERLRKEVQTSAKPFGNIGEGNEGRQNPSSERKHTDSPGPPDKQQKWNPRTVPVRRWTGGAHALPARFLPQRKSSLNKIRERTSRTFWQIWVEVKMGQVGESSNPVSQEPQV